MGEQIQRFLDSTRGARVTLPDFGPFFRGTARRTLLEVDRFRSSKMFVSAEDIYRYFAGSATVQTRDFTPALLELCRGFELLLNARLGKQCDAMRTLISGNPQLKVFVGRELTGQRKT